MSIWLDDISRERLRTGNLAELVRDMHVLGVTSNPTIFAKALSKGSAYAEQVADLAVRGVDVDEAARAITTYDIRWACDVLRPVYDLTGGVDGRVSIEVDPRLARDTAKTIAEAKALWWIVDRPNLFIKIPATMEGLPAITACLSEGISVNVTLIFSLERYGQVIDAFMAGLEGAAAAGRDLTSIASVASFFVSRVDTEIDARLDKIGTPEAQALRGKAAHRQRPARLRAVRAAVGRPTGGRRWPPPAPGRSARCGPRPASRTRSTPTPCTSPTWSRRTSSTRCRRRPCTRSPITARCTATPSTAPTTRPGSCSSSWPRPGWTTTTSSRCWRTRAWTSSRPPGTSSWRRSSPRWPQSGASDMIPNPLRDPRDRRIPRVAGPCVLVLFGVTGDLASKKLLPAIYDLANRGLLPPGFSLVGFARRDWADEDFARITHDAVKAHARTPFREEVWNQLSEGIRFVPGEFADDDAFDHLAETVAQLDAERGTGGNYAFYLSVPPKAFPQVVQQLKRSGLSTADEGSRPWRRVVIEKPFGHDLASARELNAMLDAVFPPHAVFRIDHYLGKETVQNLLALRFANTLFEPIWNRGYVDHVQITMAEDIGIGGRAGYYDGIGAARDVIQNHLLQLLALTAMEEPVSFAAESLRAEKEKVLSAVQIPEDLAAGTARGQYSAGWQGGIAVPGYLEEDGIPPDSTTETYAALRLTIDNRRWAGRAVLPAHRQAAADPDDRDRGHVPARAAPAVLAPPTPRSSARTRWSSGSSRTRA